MTQDKEKTDYGRIAEWAEYAKRTRGWKSCLKRDLFAELMVERFDKTAPKEDEQGTPAGRTAQKWMDRIEDHSHIAFADRETRRVITEFYELDREDLGGVEE